MEESKRPLTSLHLATAAAFVVLVVIAGATLVRAYAEEPITFRDPYTSLTTDEQISTIHDDLTYVLALAAGFSITDANTLRIWNQLVDSEKLVTGTVVSYTNCYGAFYPSPVPTDVCPAGTDTSIVAWPLWDSMQSPTSCATSRFGPYSPFFHFPHQNAQELGALHDWGWGITNALVGYEAYAWGAKSVMSATCRYTRTVVITTGIEAGSLPAFATYLHALADSYSHRECIEVMDSLGMPWATHTLWWVNDITPCNYNPAAPNNFDAHGREFGAWSADSARTDEAVRAVYSELQARSRQREGLYYPLTLSTTLALIDGTSPTLDEALSSFVHEWRWDQPEDRRAYADMLVSAILSPGTRLPNRRLYLPLVTKAL